MKKDRNSFFQSSNFNMSASGNMPMMGGMPNPNMMMGGMPQGMPNVNAASSQFYQANSMPMGMGMDTVYGQPSNSSMNELEAKIAKLERAINRLDARINKLEGTTYYSKETYEADGNMYMV